MKAKQNEDGSESLSLSSESAEMLEHIYSASEAAIDVLNDLLQYEHIDSGAFKLELCWRPVANFLESKLDWAKALAAKKNILLTIEDRTSDYSDLGLFYVHIFVHFHLTKQVFLF